MNSLISDRALPKVSGCAATTSSALLEGGMHRLLHHYLPVTGVVGEVSVLSGLQAARVSRPSSWRWRDAFQVRNVARTRRFSTPFGSPAGRVHHLQSRNHRGLQTRRLPIDGLPGTDMLRNTHLSSHPSTQPPCPCPLEIPQSHSSPAQHT